MKARFDILVLLLVILSACTRPSMDCETTDSNPQEIVFAEMPLPILATIDTLMEMQPYTALTLLQSFSDTTNVDSFSDFNRNYFWLLNSELLYKNDYVQSNQDKLLEAQAYFDSLNLTANMPFSPFKVMIDARCHYMNGVAYYEIDSLVDACIEYIQALEIVENRLDKDDLAEREAKFLALTYTRLTDLFSDLYLHEQAIYFSKLSLLYYQKVDVPSWYLARMLSEIGSHYDMMKQLDSANYYYQEAKKVQNDTTLLTYRDITALQTYLSYEKGENLAIVLEQMHKLVAQSESEREYWSRNLVIGEIFFLENLYDSAWIYLNQVYEYSESVGAKKQAAESLEIIRKKKNISSESFGYAEYLSQFATSSEKRGSSNSALIEIYRTYLQKMADKEHEEKTKTIRKRTIWSVVPIILLAIGGLVFSVIIKKHNKTLAAEKHTTEKQLEAENYAHKVKQAALSGKLKQSNEVLRNTLKQLEDIKTENEAIRLKTDAINYTKFVETPICRHILKTVHEKGFKSKIDYNIYKDSALNAEQLLSLRVAADEHMGQFTKRIRKRFPNLTDDDLNYCCLYLLGLNEADISALMQRAYPTVCERNRKIKRIIGEKDDLFFALRNL